MAAVVPADQPQLRYKPGYKYALRKLRLRGELNAVSDRDGNEHYFIGNFPSAALRASLGLAAPDQLPPNG